MRSLPIPISEGAKARTMPTTETWSPGRATSTISSPISLTLNVLGSCPGGKSSGFSCILRSCESIKVDSSCVNSNGPSFPQSGAAQTAGAFRNCPVCSTRFTVPHRLHLKAACRTIGRTGVARTTMPSTMINFPICLEPSLRSCSLPRS